jgi:hypothetical protein
LNGHDGGVYSEEGVENGNTFWRGFQIGGYLTDTAQAGLWWAGPQDSFITDGMIGSGTKLNPNSSNVMPFGLFVAPPRQKNPNGSGLAGGGGGTQFSNLHVWGNQQYGIFPAAGSAISFSNVVAESCGIANLVLLSNVSWVGGQIYNGGSAVATGVLVGITNPPPAYPQSGPIGCWGSSLVGTFLAGMGTGVFPFTFQQDLGCNVIKATVQGGGYSGLTTGYIQGSDEVSLLGLANSTNTELYYLQMPFQWPANGTQILPPAKNY